MAKKMNNCLEICHGIFIIMSALFGLLKYLLITAEPKGVFMGYLSIPTGWPRAYSQ